MSACNVIMLNNSDFLSMYAALGADQGCPSAKAALGYCLLLGHGVERDAVAGMRMVKDSAGSFCAEGMYVEKRQFHRDISGVVNLCRVLRNNGGDKVRTRPRA